MTGVAAMVTTLVEKGLNSSRASFKHGFSSLPQGDRLGVEFATAAHRNCLAGVGLLTPEEELRSDNYFAISVEECCNAKGSTSLAMQRFERLKDCCEREGLLGSHDRQGHERG